jgi:hypothetical protein
MNIDETNNTVETFKQACTDAGYILKDNDKQIQYLLDRQAGKINFTFEKDGKTITGYQFVSVSNNE